MTDKQHKIDSEEALADHHIPLGSERSEITRLYDQYEKECRYIKFFTPKTLKIYREIFDRWIKYVGHSLPSEDNLTQFIIGMKEALTLELKNVDLDNLLITVYGKGRKERTISISLELRRVLNNYITKHRAIKFECSRVFCTRDGKMLDYCNLHRDLKKLCASVGVDREAIDGCFTASEGALQKTIFGIEEM
jgi:Phage integrase family